MLNLDTHILIHALAGQLSPKEQRLLQNQSWGISAIVLWEIAKLVQLGRLTQDLDDPGFSRRLRRIHVWPIDLPVCREMLNLDFNSDPADEIIAATSMVHDVPLLTRDRKILKSRRVPFA